MPDAHTTLCETDLLLELAGLRHNCLEQLRTLVRRQMELIEAQDMTQLLNVLAAKHRLLIELQQLERRLDPFRGQDPQARRWRTPELHERCARTIAASEQLFREVLEQERVAEASLRRHRDEAAARLHGAQLASHARGAYVPQAPHTGRLDVISER